MKVIRTVIPRLFALVPAWLQSSAVVLILLVPVQASAQFQKPEDAIRYRQSVKFAMGQHFRHVAEMASGKEPYNPSVASDHMALVQVLGRLPWAGFAPGTDKGAAHRAKPEVWTDATKFKELSEKMMNEVNQLRTASGTGNVDQFKAAFANASQSCRACHQANRADKYSNP